MSGSKASVTSHEGNHSSIGPPPSPPWTPWPALLDVPAVGSPFMPPELVPLVPMIAASPAAPSPSPAMWPPDTPPVSGLSSLASVPPAPPGSGARPLSSGEAPVQPDSTISTGNTETLERRRIAPLYQQTAMKHVVTRDNFATAP